MLLVIIRAHTDGTGEGRSDQASTIHPPIHPRQSLMANQAEHDGSDQTSIAEDLCMQARSQITTAATSAVTLLSCEHSRHRRAERLIAKRDLQAALKYGECKMSINQRGQVTWKYTFADVVFIVDPTKKREITCWATPGAGLDVEKRRITPQIDHKSRMRTRRRLVG